jgi:hypothetical protein
MKRITSISIAILMLAIHTVSFGQSEIKTDVNNEPEKRIVYTFINEYGFYAGNAFGFTGVFVNGIRFTKTQDVIGIGIGYEIGTDPYQTKYFDYPYYYNTVENAQHIPVFVNFRHYFPGKKAFKPLVNVAIGTRISFWKESYWNWCYIDEPWNHSPYYCGEPKQRVVAGLYATAAAGFKVKTFSFTSGLFVKSWNAKYFGGFEMKVGFTF